MARHMDRGITESNKTWNIYKLYSISPEGVVDKFSIWTPLNGMLDIFLGIQTIIDS